MYNKIKYWYSKNLWTEKMVRDAVIKGVLTQDQSEQVLTSHTPVVQGS